ncbi:sensor histidine kinase [Isobaculum melis]|uniref:histidine kinase n=1 Tax=Isobaculum melis TaxID=142588 RepID=A0A1H9PXK8_9LACT|nr:HAMP domain-containing sensor histidine kinase [Isobaculum melis]SER52575.1 hypothetical protein SAMN04488559_101192 [Isobaculum melis]
MRYLYQQMLTSFIIVMAGFGIVTLAFFKTTTDTVYESTEAQLFGYADSLLSIVENSGGLHKETVAGAERLLKNQGVAFYIFNEDKELTYPNYQEAFTLKLSKDDWEKLENGKNVSIRKEEERKYAFIVIPYVVDGEFLGGIAASEPLSGIEESLTQLKRNFIIAISLSSLGAAALSFIFAKYQVKRINRMRKATHEISEGNFEIQLEDKGKDEFDELSGDFNQMVTNLKASHEEIERQENRRRQFMADAAHEMRTPLTTINGLLEGLEHDMIPEDKKGKSITLMQNETRRLIRLVNENLDYENIRSNQIVLNKQHFNLKDTLDIIGEQLEQKAADSGNIIKLAVDPRLKVYADYDRFIQIVVNIVQNAIQFTKDGEITLSATENDTAVRLEIQDTGIGMNETELKNIWERYYKADPSRKNTKYGESGLGLAIVQQLMTLHGATIEVTSESNQGTTFILQFPKKPSETEKS